MPCQPVAYGTVQAVVWKGSGRISLFLTASDWPKGEQGFSGRVDGSSNSLVVARNSVPVGNRFAIAVKIGADYFLHLVRCWQTLFPHELDNLLDPGFGIPQ